MEKKRTWGPNDTSFGPRCALLSLSPSPSSSWPVVVVLVDVVVLVVIVLFVVVEATEQGGGDSGSGEVSHMPRIRRVTVYLYKYVTILKHI